MKDWGGTRRRPHPEPMRGTCGRAKPSPGQPNFDIVLVSTWNLSWSFVARPRYRRVVLKFRRALLIAPDRCSGAQRPGFRGGDSRAFWSQLLRYPVCDEPPLTTPSDGRRG